MLTDAEIRERLSDLIEQTAQGPRDQKILAGCLSAVLGSYIAGEPWGMRMLEAQQPECHALIAVVAEQERREVPS